MMDTTTPVDGDTQVSQPTQTEAVEVGDQVIATDENGTPSLMPATSDADEATEPEADTDTTDSTVEESEPVTDPAQAEDVGEWAKKKGLPMDNPVKLAQMYRDAERRMHEAIEKSRELENQVISQPLAEYTGDPTVDALAAQVNSLLIKNNVQDFFSTNPDARAYESKMAEIVTERPHLKNDLDALYALAKNDPSREADLKREGGRHALTNLAQKQQAVPPQANATNSGVYETSAITPQNVYDQIDSHDQAWFQKNYAEINKAISGK